MYVHIEHEFKQNTLRGFMFVTSNIHTYVHECKKDWKGIYQNYTIISIILTI